MSDEQKKRGRPKMLVHEAEAPAILTEILATESRLRELRAEYGAIALAAHRGEDGADNRLVAVQAAIDENQHRHGVLKAAHGEAEANDARIFAEIRRQNYKSQVQRAQRLFAKRDAAARKLVKLLGEAVTVYREVVEISGTAAKAVPFGQHINLGEGYTGSGQIKRAVSVELWRLSGHTDGIMPTAPVFPGAEMPRIGAAPSREPPFDERLRLSAEILLEKWLHGGKPKPVDSAPATATKPAEPVPQPAAEPKPQPVAELQHQPLPDGKIRYVVGEAPPDVAQGSDVYLPPAPPKPAHSDTAGAWSRDELDSAVGQLWEER